MSQSSLDDLFDDIRNTCESCEHPVCLETIRVVKLELSEREEAARVDELEYILSNASGGGSWRRIVNQRLSTLKPRQAGGEDGKI
jgi:hypothetical protein